MASRPTSGRIGGSVERRLVTLDEPASAGPAASSGSWLRIAVSNATIDGPGSSPSSSTSTRRSALQPAQRVGLTAGPVQQLGQALPTRLPERMIGHQLLQLGEHLTRLRAGDVGVGGELDHLQPSLRQTGAHGGGERGVPDPSQRRSRPQPEGLPGPRQRLGNLPGGERRPRLIGQPLEAMGVHGIGLHLQHIAPGVRPQHVADTDLTEVPTDPRHVHLQRGPHPGGTSSPHTASTNRSADTTRPASSPNRATIPRCFAPANDVRCPPASTSTGPSSLTARSGSVTVVAARRDTTELDTPPVRPSPSELLQRPGPRSGHHPTLRSTR